MEDRWHYMSWTPKMVITWRNQHIIVNKQTILNCMQTQMIVRGKWQGGYVTSAPFNPDGNNGGGACTTSAPSKPDGNNGEGCNGLNRSLHHRFTHLNTWSPVAGVAWGGYRTIVRWSLAKETASLHWGCCSFIAWHPCLICLLCAGENMSFQLLLPCFPGCWIAPPAPWRTLLFWNHKAK